MSGRWFLELYFHAANNKANHSQHTHFNTVETGARIPQLVHLRAELQGWEEKLMKMEYSGFTFLSQWYHFNQELISIVGHGSTHL